MADRPLSEATADLRLSDAKFDQDVRRARTRLLQITRELEAVAQVEVTASLDTTKTRRDIEAGLRRMQATTALVVPVTASTTAAEAQVAGFTAKVGASKATIKIDADTSAAQAQLIAFARVQEQLAGDIVRGVRSSQIEQARASLQRLAILSASTQDARIDIDPDLRDAGVRAELARIQTLVTALDGQSIDIPIDLNAAEVIPQLARIEAIV